jgi:hypothetical protein
MAILGTKFHNGVKFVLHDNLLGDNKQATSAVQSPLREMQETYFYHSFPRHHEHDPNFTLGLGILRSILKRGLLLTAEEFPQSGHHPPGRECA